MEKFLALKLRRPFAGKVVVLYADISNPAPATIIVLALRTNKELLGVKNIKHLVLIPTGWSKQVDFASESLFHYNNAVERWKGLLESLEHLQLQKVGQIKWAGLCEDHVPPVAEFVIQKQDAWELRTFKATVLVPLLQLYPTCGSLRALVDISERSEQQPGKYGLTAPQAKQMTAKFEDWFETFKQRMTREWSEISNIRPSLEPLERLSKSEEALVFAKMYGFLDVIGDLEAVEEIHDRAQKAFQKQKMMGLEDRGDFDRADNDSEGADEEAEGAELRDLRPDPLRDYDPSGGGWYHPSGTNILREHESEFRYHDEARHNSDEEPEYE